MAMHAQVERRWMPLAIAAGYALLYLIIRPSPDAGWALASGIRLACLLIFPFRYWPALAVGETVPLILLNSQLLAHWGVFAVALWSIPPIVAGMPVVWWCRNHLALLSPRHQIDMRCLLLCAVGLSIVWALLSCAEMFLIHGLNMMFMAHSLVMIGLFMNNYIAMLAIVPFALILRMNYRQNKLFTRWQILVGSQLLRDMVFRLLPAIAALAVLGTLSRGDIGQIACMLMLPPVVWLTLRHGWRASVAGSAMMIVFMDGMLRFLPDASVLKTQAVIGIAGTCVLALGAHISIQRQQREQERLARANAQQVARRNLLLGEQRMQRTSQALVYVASIMRIDYGHLLDNFVPDEQKGGYHQLANEMEQRVHHLAESLHSRAWHEHGLSAALQDTIGRALSEAGIAYVCDVSGCRLGFLPDALQAAIYRTACELVVRISAPLACKHIRLVLRVARLRGRTVVLLRIDGAMDDLHAASAIYHAKERERVASKLGALVLPFDEVRDLIRLFDGELRTRPSSNRLRISVLLRDDAQPAPDASLMAESLPFRMP